MSLNTTQKLACQAIVNIFETGRVQGRYDQVTLLTGDTGQLTYGRSQTTLTSGNLYLLIKAYCNAPAATFATSLAKYLDRLATVDSSLNHDMEFRGLLRQAGNDPIMHVTQDAFFDRVYWEPAVKDKDNAGITAVLGVAVVFDSHIHGSWRLMYNRTIASAGKLADLGEQAWISAYVKTRRDWLAKHPNELLHKTVYRMDSFLALITEGKWNLDLPFRVRGCVVDEEALNVAQVPVRASAADVDEVILKLKTPPITGSSVEALQQALNQKLGPGTVDVDGSFGLQTDAVVRTFQKSAGLVVDGIVGPATWSALR